MLNIAKIYFLLMFLLTSTFWHQAFGQCAAISIECGGYQGGSSYYFSTIGESNDYGIADYSNCSSSSSLFDAPDMIFEYVKTDFNKSYITLFNYSADLDIFVLENCDGGPNRNAVACIAKSDFGFGEIYGGVNFDFVEFFTPGTYYIVIDGYNSSEVDDFNLSISCDEFWDCSSEHELFCNDNLFGSTCVAPPFLVSTSKNNSYSCEANPAWTGFENVYKFQAPQQGKYYFEVNGLTDDIDMFILDNSDCNFMSGNDCIYSSTESGTSPESGEVTLSQGQTVFVVLDGWLDACSDYEISISCTGFDCNSSASINCGQYVEDNNFGGTNFAEKYRNSQLNIDYFNLIGNEKIYEFSPEVNGEYSFYLSITGNSSVDLDIFILENCDPESVIATSDAQGNAVDLVTAYLNAGFTYFIVVDGDGTSNTNVASDFLLSVNCPDICNSTQLQCKKPIVDDNFTVHTFSTKFNNFSFYRIGNRFYTKLTGGEAFFNFTPEVTQEYEIEITEVLLGNDLDIFISETCDPLACIATTDGNSLEDGDVVKVTLEAGKEYQIIVDGDNGDESDFKIVINGCKDFLDDICESMSPIISEDFESYIKNSPIFTQSVLWSSSGSNNAIVVDNSTLLKTQTLSVPNNSETAVFVGNNLSYSAYKIDHDLEIFYTPTSGNTNVLPDEEIYILDASLPDLVKSVTIKMSPTSTTLNYVTSGLFGSNSEEILNLGDIFYKGTKSASKKFRVSWVIDIEGNVALFIDGVNVSNYNNQTGFGSLSYGFKSGITLGHMEVDNLCIGGCHKDGTHACNSKEELSCDKFEDYVSGVQIQNYSGWTTGGLSQGCKVGISPTGGKALKIEYANSDCGAEYMLTDPSGLKDVVELNYDIYIPTDGGLQSIIYNDDPNGYMFFNFIKDELNYQIGTYAAKDYHAVNIPLNKYFKFRLQLNKANGTVRVYFDDKLFTEVINTNISSLTSMYFDSNLSSGSNATYIDNVCLDKCKECTSYTGPFEVIGVCSNIKFKKIATVNDDLSNYTFTTNGLPIGTWSLQEEDINGQSTTVVSDQATTDLDYGCKKGKKYIICYRYFDADGCEIRCYTKLDLWTICGGGGITPTFIGSETNNQFNFTIDGLTADEEVSNWYIDETAIGTDMSINYTFPAPGQRYLCCLIYNKVTGCYRICCRRYCIENPLICTSISTATQNDGVSYILQVEGAQQIISWNIDLPQVTNNYIGNDNPQSFVPANFGITIGQSIVISVKYIDFSGCSKVCCKRITYNPGTGNDPKVIFNLEETCISPNQGAEIPVTVENFDKVGAFNFTLILPFSAKVKMVNIVNSTLQNVTYNLISDQELIVAWDDPSGNSMDLADNTRIFNVSISADTDFTMGTKIVGNSVAVLSDVHANGSVTGGEICFSTGQLVTGTIKNEIGKAHPNLKVDLMDGGQIVKTTNTNSTGSYSFAIATPQNIIKPLKNDEVRKGVNVVDVARIRRHFLQKTFLDSDYKMVAADVNKDGKINIVDVALVNRVFLKKVTAFPNNTSWRFLPESLDISSNPLNIAWPEEVDLSASGLDYNAINFVSIKVGDVDNSALFRNGGNYDTDRSTDIEISIPDTSVSAYDPVLLPINATNFEDVSVLTFEVNYNPDEVEFMGIEDSKLEGFSEGNYNDVGGTVIVGWDHPQAAGQTLNDNIMKFKFKARQSTITETELTFSSMQALDVDFGELGIVGSSAKINFMTTETNDVLTANYTNIFPNPFANKLNISIRLAEAQKVEIIIHDASGRLLRKINTEKASTKYNYALTDIDYKGVLLCTIKGETFTTTKKVIKI